MGEEIILCTGDECDGEGIKAGVCAGYSCGDITGNGYEDLHEIKRSGEVFEMGSGSGDEDCSHTGD